MTCRGTGRDNAVRRVLRFISFPYPNQSKTSTGTAKTSPPGGTRMGN